jgi:hypothetical protein
MSGAEPKGDQFAENGGFCSLGNTNLQILPMKRALSTFSPARRLTAGLHLQNPCGFAACGGSGFTIYLFALTTGPQNSMNGTTIFGVLLSQRISRGVIGLINKLLILSKAFL